MPNGKSALAEMPQIAFYRVSHLLTSCHADEVALHLIERCMQQKKKKSGKKDKALLRSTLYANQYRIYVYAPGIYTCYPKHLARAD
jgi:hypothetical protein